MAARKKGLGRGLDSLLGNLTPSTTAAVATTANNHLRELPVDLIQRGKYQPRRDMDPESLAELAQSIRQQGVMQPIVVRSIGDQRYEIIAGERRWRATQQAGLDSIPVIIKDVGDEAAIAMALIENIQREDLNPIEEARALQRLQLEFELTQQQVADAVGKSRPTIANLLRLMSLREEVQTCLEHGDLEMGHAKALLGLEADAQVSAAKMVVAKGLSVRQTEAMVRSLQNESKPAKNEQRSADVRQLEQKLAEALGAEVLIQANARGKGRLVVKYNSLNELDGILSHIS
ncbi:MAG: ParB family chromosome partitioning protein [Halieaceae bacterium]|jgi:ParB family chromosome partitioning protein